MSMDTTKELIFQNEMIAQMVKTGWIVGKGDGYDRERALYSQDALTFVQTTQPQEWEKFSKIYPTDTERHFLDALVAQLRKSGYQRYRYAVADLRHPRRIAARDQKP